MPSGMLVSVKINQLAMPRKAKANGRNVLVDNEALGEPLPTTPGGTILSKTVRLRTGSETRGVTPPLSRGQALEQWEEEATAT